MPNSSTLSGGCKPKHLVAANALTRACSDFVGRRGLPPDTRGASWLSRCREGEIVVGAHARKRQREWRLERMEGRRVGSG
jgi:hypothetical protein